MPDPTVLLNFKDMAHSVRVQEAVELRCSRLAEEFPETTKFEITITPEGPGFSAHGHVIGRRTDVAGHTEGRQPGEAADGLLDKLERSLRKTHDKKIFNNRRDARKADAKRNTG